MTGLPATEWRVPPAWVTRQRWCVPTPQGRLPETQRRPCSAAFPRGRPPRDPTLTGAPVSCSPTSWHEARDTGKVQLCLPVPGRSLPGPTPAPPRAILISQERQKRL